jgi:predicted RNA-binding protein with PUA-like domain
VEGMTSFWLVKSEPSKYAFSDLEREGKTTWDGVRNAQAAIYLRAMRLGDLVLYYHSREDLAVVGIAEVTRESFQDPTDPTERFVAVELSPKEPLKRPVALRTMRENPALSKMVMFRQFRLSVTPVTADEWRVILEMSQSAVS